MTKLIERLNKVLSRAVEDGIGKVLRDCVIHITIVINPKGADHGRS